MTPKQFNQLDEMEQAEVVWDGKHVATRDDGTHSILLYKIHDNFYVEAYYHKKYNVLRKFVALNEYEVLFYKDRNN